VYRGGVSLVPLQKVALKKSESCAKLVAEVAQKNQEKLRLSRAQFGSFFGCKILLWSFGTLVNFGNEQQNNVYQYYIGPMKCKS